MKLQVGKSYKNAFTGAVVEITNLKRGFEFGWGSMPFVEYTKEFATPAEKGMHGEIDAGTKENQKPEYVFKQTYLEI